MSFEELIQQNEVSIRLGFFFGVFAVMAIWEVIAPRRALTVSKAVRWANNLGLVFFNSFILRLLFPAAAVGMAAFAREQGWGIFESLIHVTLQGPRLPWLTVLERMGYVSDGRLIAAALLAVCGGIVGALWAVKGKSRAVEYAEGRHAT